MVPRDPFFAQVRLQRQRDLPVPAFFKKFFSIEDSSCSCLRYDSFADWFLEACLAGPFGGVSAKRYTPVVVGCAVLLADRRIPGCPILAVNDAVEKLTGYPPADLVGKAAARAESPVRRVMLRESKGRRRPGRRGRGKRRRRRTA